MKGCVFFILMVTGFSGLSLDTVRVDLSNRWHSFEKNKFINFNGDGKTAYIQLTYEDYGALEIKDTHPFSIFLNNRLVTKATTKIKWTIDSLKESVSFPIQISVFSETGTKNLTTNLISIANDHAYERKYEPAGNLIIGTSFILLAALVLLIRANPQATKEYFNLMKVFTIRNTDEGAVTLRVTSANNVFIYIFCSALMALNLFVYSGYGHNTSQEGGDIFLTYFPTAMVVVFLIMILKIIIISLSARLFKLSELAAGQFFNFIRLLLLGFSISSVVLLAAFMLELDYRPLIPTLISFIMTLVLVFLVITFIKLNHWGRFTVFHLFSYLCASEIIPLIILLNIYFS